MIPLDGPERARLRFSYESKLLAVHTAIRDAGRGLTLDEIAAAAGYPSRQIAPVVWWLWRAHGAIAPLPGSWPRFPRWATARLAATYPDV